MASSSIAKMLLLLLPSPSSSTTIDVWHLTDPHVDPWYVEGSNAAKCYCESHESCPRMGNATVCDSPADPAQRAQPWGTSEGNCASPVNLFESAVAFMAAHSGAAPLIYFTGDFGEAGASYPCGLPNFKPTTPGLSEAQQQINDLTAGDFARVRAKFPAAKILGCLGNHDTVPGDYEVTGPTGQAWQFSNLTSTWGADLGYDPAALETLGRGGYYSTSPLPGLRILSLNTNYWDTLNRALKNATSPTFLEGQRQFEWLEAELRAAAGRKEAVHILGHIPPTTQKYDSKVINMWRPHFFQRFAALVVEFKDTVKATFMGHVHTEEWAILRECGGANTTAAHCSGAAASMILPGPAMTEGYPARNPAVRLLKFDAQSFELLEMETYYTDLRVGNRNGRDTPLKWELEYDFRTQFGMAGLTPRDFEELHAEMAEEGSVAWGQYMGQGDGSIRCSKYDSKGAPFPPKGPCEKCSGGCKESYLRFLNGTATLS